MEYKSESAKDYVFAKLPIGWHYKQGLSYYLYPIRLKLADGGEKVVKNYEEHHAFIKRLFGKK